ncbi:MAG: aromatic ring-hydroxylating dioxygenase subunit alpha [Betaproteobacteria bacterium]|nr:aromatic ring-hydroxylating dioxygenase subunit alpha [Betaproteobacteria bacterium]
MNYPFNAWYPAIWSKDLIQGELLSRTYLGRPVVLFRSESGLPVAMDDLCPHRFAPLSRGKMLPGNVIRCMYHGLEFDASGQCVRNPHGDRQIPRNMCVRTYRMTEKHTLIWIWMGDRDPGASDVIADFSVLDEQSGLSTQRDGIMVAANFRLLADNLMDLSHAAFLHEGILSSPESASADIEVEQSGNTVRCRRVMVNTPVSKLHDLMFRRDGAPVDAWTDIRWDPPGCLLLDAGVRAPGTDDQFSMHLVHFLTPETERTTHYLFGVARRPRPADAEARKQIAELRRFAFDEQDRPMMEAQQANIDRLEASGGAHPVLVASIDAGPARMQRVLDRMMSEESSHAPSRQAAFSTQA